jgi:hypothetical protein
LTSADPETRGRSPVPSNAIAHVLAQIVANATVWEIVAALVGVAAIGFAFWGVVDNIYDIRALRHDGQESGPLRIAASFLLMANVLFLIGWGGYTHVALIAAYLPPRSDVSGGAMTEIASMRLLYGVSGFLAQVVLRYMRSRLRGLSREEWEPFFGEAAEWKAKYHQSQSEVHRQRSEKHDYAQRTTSAELRNGVLERMLRQNGMEPPPRASVPS